MKFEISSLTCILRNPFDIWYSQSFEKDGNIVSNSLRQGTVLLKFGTYIDDISYLYDENSSVMIILILHRISKKGFSLETIANYTYI